MGARQDVTFKKIHVGGYDYFTSKSSGGMERKVCAFVRQSLTMAMATDGCSENFDGLHWEIVSKSSHRLSWGMIPHRHSSIAILI
jgi:hypothetical protein